MINMTNVLLHKLHQANLRGIHIRPNQSKGLMDLQTILIGV